MGNSLGRTRWVGIQVEDGWVDPGKRWVDGDPGGQQLSCMGSRFAGIRWSLIPGGSRNQGHTYTISH